jgi:hypothetical protein
LVHLVTKRYCGGIAGIFVFIMLIATAHVSAAVPAGVSGAQPAAVTLPLSVSFSDIRNGVSSGLTGYFGNAVSSPAWTVMSAGNWRIAGSGYTGGVLPDGSILLMGRYQNTSDLKRSVDYGATWTPVTVKANAGWSVTDLHTSVVFPDGRIVVMGGVNGTERNETWISSDAGATWNLANASPGWTARASLTSVVMPDRSIVLMGGGNSTTRISTNDTWRSADNGATWSLMTAHAGWSARQGHTSVVLPDGRIVLMGGDDGSNRNDVWLSSDNGATWKLVNASAGWTARYGHTSVMMPDGSIILTGGLDWNQTSQTGGYQNDVWRSADAGATWNQVTEHAGWPARRSHTSVVMRDGSIVLAGGRPYYYDVWRSTDYGATWTAMADGSGWPPRFHFSSIVLSDGSIVLMGGYDGNVAKNDVWRSTDDGATWSELTTAAGWEARYGQSSVAMPDGSIVLMGGGNDTSVMMNDTWRSTDKGATWTRMTEHAAWPARFGPSAVVMPDRSIVLAGGYIWNRTTNADTYMNDVWRSTDGGSTWTLVNAGCGWSPRNIHTSVVTPDGSIVLMGGFRCDNTGCHSVDDVWKSADAGASWVMVNDSAWMSGIAMSGVTMPDSSILLTGGVRINSTSDTFSNTTWRSADNGATWTQVAVNTGWTPRYGHTNVVMPDGSIVLMGGFDDSTGYRNDVWRLAP